MESELDRLERLYRELGDEHLKDLADDADDLTDEGRMVLAREMRRRGFAPAPAQDDAVPDTPAPTTDFGPSVPGIFPGGSTELLQALEPGGEQRLGWTSVTSFHDGIELARGCEALDDADVDIAIEEIAGDAMNGAPQSYSIWVRDEDAEQARIILHARIGLFPVAETEAPQADGYSLADADEMMDLGHFDTEAEARNVAAVLERAGIVSTLTAPDLEDGEQWYTVAVQGRDLDRGLETVTDALRSTTAL